MEKNTYEAATIMDHESRVRETSIEIIEILWEISRDYDHFDELWTDPSTGFMSWVVRRAWTLVDQRPGDLDYLMWGAEKIWKLSIGQNIS